MDCRPTGVNRSAGRRDPTSLIKQVWSVLHPGLALAALLGAPACAHRPPPSVAAAPAPDQAVALPAQFNGKAFFVEVAVGDRGPFRFWLDTGASWTVLTPRLADELAAAGLLHDVADGRVATAAGQRQRYDFRRLTELRLAGYRVPEAMAFVTDLTALNRALGTNFDGVLGMELFRSSQLILDYRTGSIALAPTNHPAPPASVRIPCRYEAYTPVIELVVGSKRTPMLIDSGADAGFYLPQRTKAAHFRSRPVVVSHAVTATGTVERRAARLAHDLEFGGLRFETPTVTMTPAGFGLIGSDVLKHFTLGFNPSRGEVWLLPSGDRNSVTFPPITNLGFFMVADGDAFHVTRVLDGSDAARAGMRPGDRITSINGLPAPQWTPRSLTELAQATEPLEMSVRRRSVTRTLRVRPFMAVE